MSQAERARRLRAKMHRCRNCQAGLEWSGCYCVDCWRMVAKTLGMSVVTALVVNLVVWAVNRWF